MSEEIYFLNIEHPHSYAQGHTFGFSTPEEREEYAKGFKDRSTGWGTENAISLRYLTLTDTWEPERKF